MAQFETPVKVKRGDDVREAANDTQLNQLLWDGFLVQDGEKAEPASKPSGRKTTARKPRASTSTPASPTDTAADTAASGNTAAGETTVGSNPS